MVNTSSLLRNMGKTGGKQFARALSSVRGSWSVDYVDNDSLP